ncbi:hypothetical protein pEaSNUABM37_00247 [Erwinia phage pEa_SNUABM_37]|nr:hypothetical protein pEaSNUABM37_00247 [Erwinia phage pEa_SNUABM_37]QXO10715.1 hypothetical protein pEaSNUABM48_00247 [Erwinia phage pEa_SNUABM_48]
MVFTTTTQRADLIFRTMKERLIDIGDIDVSLLVYMALNQLTINVTISAQQVHNVEQLVQIHLPQYGYEKQQVIVGVCEAVAAVLYQDYQAAMSNANFALPAKLVKVDYSFGVVAMVFECLDDQSCAWSYTTLDQ